MSKKAVQYLKGVGPVRARQLARLGISTCQDLVLHFPREYSRRQPVSIRQLPSLPGETVLISGKISQGPREFRRRVQVLSITVADETGTVRCTWFNQGYLRDKLHFGQPISLAGKYSPDFGGNIVVEEYSLKGELSEIRPQYNLTEGISNQVMAGIIRQALSECPALQYFPETFRQKYRLLPYQEALGILHSPGTLGELDSALFTAKFAELFFYQLSFMYWRRLKSRLRGLAHREVEGLLPLLEKGFGFRYSEDQVRAVKEIQADLAQNAPMSRLLLGDVGSGKTAVAAFALFTSAFNGYKAVLMAPTEIVARQHYKTLLRVPSEAGVKIHLLTGSTKRPQREIINGDLTRPGGVILVGTHAVFQAEVSVKDLSLVITDEQHRFGVQQRLSLREKGENPHVLAMSATPIPRTLAMTLYGDLDISTIAQKPTGRLAVKTKVISGADRPQVFAFLRQEIAKGNTGYIICPLIEESEEISAFSLQAYQQILAKGLPGIPYGVLHGRLSGEEKEQVITDLGQGKFHFLLATTVVEVGVDVGNATFMVIENSERFGLAQLHQLRGRVGRRDLQSYCFLITDGPERERLRILEETDDGFTVAYADLRLRGAGQFLGLEQHGLNEFKLADVVRDTAIAQTSRQAAAEILEQVEVDPAWGAVFKRIKAKIANLKS